MSDSLPGNTRKIVPSAILAAEAIWRVVTEAPYSARRGVAAAMIAARRCSGGSAVARRDGGCMEFEVYE
jgi:hypothetical protein